MLPVPFTKFLESSCQKPPIFAQCASNFPFICKLFEEKGWSDPTKISLMTFSIHLVDTSERKDHYLL